MATYVLVHGGGHGGWCYQRVARRLRAEGHEVHAPSLTGLGDRAHLLGPHVDLHLHARDVAALIFYEDLRDVILVGHSYGGMVITGAADLAWMAERLAPHPWQCFEQPLDLQHEDALWAIPQYHIVCTSTLATRDPELMATAKAEGRLWAIDTGHDLMITEPEATTQALLDVAAA